MAGRSLVPLVAVVPESTVAELTPTMVAISSSILATPAWLALCRKNGWTPEMIAWGTILTAAAKLDLQTGGKR